MEHEIPKSTSTPSRAPSRSTPARSASTTVCGSAPESRRLFLTGAKPGTKFCSWNESTSYDHPTKQPRAATPGREATPGPQHPPRRRATRTCGESGRVQERGKAQWGRETRGTVWRRRWAPWPTPPRRPCAASPTRCPAVYAALTANARLGEDVCGTVATFA